MSAPECPVYRYRVVARGYDAAYVEAYTERGALIGYAETIGCTLDQAAQAGICLRVIGTSAV